jgi:putative ABC transport system ATP-binding protein
MGDSIMIIKTKNLKKYYGSEPNMVCALDGVDIEIKAGEFTAVTGQSGSGKSTLLHLLGGLDKPTHGTVVVDGHELAGMTDEQLTIFRRRNVGFVFQSFNLVPILSVSENISLPVELDGNKADSVYINEIIGLLGLKEKRDVMPNQLSGGQQQRVAIARALAAKPSIILADEPTGNLDSKTSQDVLNLLKMTSERFKQTIMMITHNEHIAQLADRIIHIEDGKILSDTGAA